jgi:hypothetical protein
MTNKPLTEQLPEPRPFKKLALPLDPNHAAALVLQALRGHQTLDMPRIEGELKQLQEDVNRLRDGDLDAIRTSLATMSKISEAAAMRYAWLAEQQNGQGSIEAKSALMRVSFAAMRTHAQTLSTLAALPVKVIE